MNAPVFILLVILILLMILPGNRGLGKQIRSMIKIMSKKRSQ